MHEEGANLQQAATMLVLVVRIPMLMVVGGMLVFIVMVMVVPVLDRPGGLGPAYPDPAIDHHIDLG